MDIISIFRAVWRHKLVTIPVILLTCLGAFYVVAIKAPVYQASASFALVYPPSPPTQAQIAADPKLAQVNSSNPLLGYSDPSAVTQIVISLVGTTSSQQALEKAGAGTQYQIGPSAGSSVIVDVTGVGSTAQAAELSAKLVTNAAENALYQVQANQGVNARYMIKSYQLATANEAAQKLSGKLRSLIAVLGVGILLLFIAISIAEAMRKGQRMGKGKQGVESPTTNEIQAMADRPDREPKPLDVPGNRRY
jgi:hypothetical protein